MRTDRELLMLAAKSAGPLADIGWLAAFEHSAWLDRNRNRSALRAFYRDYTAVTGEWFDRGDAIDGEGGGGDVPKFDKLKAELKDAQRKLTAARAATRRAIVRAAAEIGAAIKSENGSKNEA